MKQTVFEDIYTWSVFSPERQIDFNGHLWIRPEGNVLFDPVAMSAGDLEQFDAMGGAAWNVLTNRDHERQADLFRQRSGARIVLHADDAPQLQCEPDRQLADDEEIVPGLQAIRLRHGKSPGELALYWRDKKLVLVGDLVVGAPLGRFTLLMDEKLADPVAAALELRRLLALDFDAVLVGDGHSIVRDARRQLVECLEERSDLYINRINLDEMEWVAHSARAGYDWQQKDVDPLVGARELGYRLIRLASGQATYPLHFHHFGEEMAHVLEGECTLLTPRGDWPVRPGDVIAFAPGPSGTHKFRNDSGAPCVLLILGQSLAHDVCEYPDSEKVSMSALGAQGIYRKKDAISYWEGE